MKSGVDDGSQVQEQRKKTKKTLAKRKSELANMQDRLLNGYLAGTVDETTSAAKSAELKQHAEEVARQLDEADRFDPALGQVALNVFDFSQNLVEIWHGSNSAVRREALECVSLNRTLSDVTLGLPKRKPFDLLAEGLLFGNTRGERI